MPRQTLYTVFCTVLGGVLLLGASAASVQLPHTPPVTHGISAGDVTSTSAVIWARTDRNANMHVLLHGDTPPARHTTLVRAAHDYAGKMLLTHLRPNTTYHYTVWFTDTPHPHTERPPGVHGTFRTAPLPSDPQAVHPFPASPRFTVHEFTSGPMSAIILPPDMIGFEDTLHPTRLFAFGPAGFDTITTFADAKTFFNFGVGTVDASGQFTIAMVNARGDTVFTTTLRPQ